MNGRITEAPAYLRGHCAYVFRCECIRHQGLPIFGDDSVAMVQARANLIASCSEIQRVG